MKKLLTIISLSFCFALQSQTGTEIYLFDLHFENGQISISNPKNISNHKGYDNQPYFHHRESVLYFSSFDDAGRSDIKSYNFETLETKNLTLSQEREYSPTLTPDENFISCIIQRDNGAQDLGKFPVDGGDPTILIDNYLVGYHAWIDETKLLAYTLLEDIGELHFIDLETNEDLIIAKNIGRSLHKIPGQQAMSYIDKTQINNWQIKKFDPVTRNISTIASTLPLMEHLCWTQNGLILMSDGNKIYSLDPLTSNKWIPVVTKGEFSFMKGITRLAVNRKNNLLAVVVNE